MQEKKETSGSYFPRPFISLSQFFESLLQASLMTTRGAFLPFVGILGDSDRRGMEDLICQGIHKRMAFALYDETRFVILQLEHLDNHAPIFGEQESIKVWVGKEEDLRSRVSERKFLAISPDMREVP